MQNLALSDLIKFKPIDYVLAVLHLVEKCYLVLNVIALEGSNCSLGAKNSLS